MRCTRRAGVDDERQLCGPSERHRLNRRDALARLFVTLVRAEKKRQLIGIVDELHLESVDVVFVLASEGQDSVAKCNIEDA